MDTTITAVPELGHAPKNSISFNTEGAPTPMLIISKDGFFVRDTKVKQNRLEAKRVYKAFKAFLRTAGTLR